MRDESIEPCDVQATFCATLVDEWFRLGVSQAMIAPGSRSTPMALALMSDSRWSVSVFHDERSTAFAALGYAISSSRPALVLCTSGTAATHFHAAVVEADLSAVPMLVVTADRPPESQDVGAAQTIRQDGLFSGAVRWSHDPGVPILSVAPSWRSLARRSFSAATGGTPGPVHLNLPFREPLVGRALALPAASSDESLIVGRATLDDEARRRLQRRFDVQRPLLVVGRGASESVIEQALATGWPVIADARMRRHRDVITHFDSVLRVPAFADTHRPDVVVRIGEAPASKTLAQWLIRHDCPQVHVSFDGRVFDPDHRIVTRVVASDVDLRAIFASLPSIDGSTWVSEWRVAERMARDVIRREIETLGVGAGVSAVSTFVGALPPDAALVVSSSMPIRDVEWFSGPLGERFVVSNRGANGIDGVLATAIGVALHRGGPVGVVIGDVALLHDSSSMAGLSARGVDIRILVVDNDGGGIFHHLPQATSVDPPVFERIYGTPHGTDFALLARAHHLAASVVADPAELQQVASRPGPSLAIVRTDRDGDVAAHRLLHTRVAESLRAG